MQWFQRIADAFQAAGVKAILVGGHAVNHYGYGRLTMDVDLMIAAHRQQEAAHALAGLGFGEVCRSAIFLRMQHSDRDAAPVDLLLIDEPTFEKVESSGVLARIEDRDFIVPSVDVLICMKLHSLRFGRRRLIKDGGDIVELLLRTGRTPDDIAALGKQYGSPEVMREIRFLYECDNRVDSSSTHQP